MDETAVWKERLSSTTVDKVGSKTVSIKTTGHEKEKVSVCLAAKADGTKLKPFIMFTAGKRECAALNEQFRDKCIIKSDVIGWMNEQLTEEWIDSVVGRFAFGRKLLSWNSFRCHISDSVREKLKAFNEDAVVVPGDCTKYVQATVVSWNKPFKAAMTEKYDEGVRSLSGHAIFTTRRHTANCRTTVSTDPTRHDQKIVKDTIRDMIAMCDLPTTAQHLVVSTPCTSRFYTLPKIHKANNPGCSIVPACCCPTENSIPR